jgi:excinuclease ABC subunit C
MESGYLKEQLKSLPTKPGVYLLKDAQGNVLYVGKALSLYHRVRSYFGSPLNLTPKLQKMVAKVAELEFFVTDSEQEAILLECSLIKKYHPRYNVRLKDDKSFPYLKISLNEDYPRVYPTRRLEKDGARYFGPFASASSVRHTLNLLKKLFPFRSCNRAITGKDSRPCLEYHIDRCRAPCLGKVSREEYREVIQQVLLFLEGKQEMVLRELRRRMEEAAENLEFEKAALFRDQIRAVEKVIERQKIAAPEGEQDVIAMARGEDRAYVAVFFIRNGNLLGREHFILEGTQDETPSRIITSFLQQFYNSAPYVPPLILLQYPPEEAESLEKWLGSRRGEPVALAVPREGMLKELVDLVAENARHEWEQFRVKLLAEPEALTTALAELQQWLRLPDRPRRVECYDISDIRGTSAVGSMVVFQNGLPQPSHYRRFQIKTVAGANDYAMLQEILRRRLKRASSSADDSSWSNLPDLILIDGGKGQLNAALEVMQELGAEQLPVASIAKSEEEVFLPGESEPVLLPRHSPALYLLQRIRDEAHRFALSYHVKQRRKSSLASALDAVPGIGPRRKRALLRRFGSVSRIKEASLEELLTVPGMNRSAARKLKELL